MKIVYKFLASLALLASVSACNLDHNPSDALIFTNYDEMFHTYEESTGYYNSMNAALRSVQQNAYWTVSDVQTDMFNITKSSGNRMGTVSTMNDGFTASDDYTAVSWNGFLTVVNYANYFIANIDNVDVDAEELSAADKANFDLYCGTAYFLRAYALHNLAIGFAPAYTRCDPSTTPAAPVMLYPDVLAKPSRQSLESLYKQVLEDMAISEDYLASHAAKTYGNITVTLDALKALYAQVHLSLGNYTEAATYADELINCGTYSLASSVSALEAEFITQSNCTETILMSYASLQEVPNSNSIYYGSQQGTATTGTGKYAYSPDFLPTKTLYDLYSATDTRKSVFFQSETISSEGTQSITTFFGKYRGNPSLTSNAYNASITMPRILAIPEQYLIAAEALAMAGDEGTAKTYLNLLQKARGASLTDGSMENIKKEWARETVGEGKRLQCLKRWGDGFSGREPININYVLNTDNSPYYVNIEVAADYYKLIWPVPTNEIVNNPNLEQNAGW